MDEGKLLTCINIFLTFVLMIQVDILRKKIIPYEQHHPRRNL